MRDERPLAGEAAPRVGRARRAASSRASNATSSSASRVCIARSPRATRPRRVRTTTRARRGRRGARARVRGGGVRGASTSLYRAKNPRRNDVDERRCAPEARHELLGDRWWAFWTGLGGVALGGGPSRDAARTAAGRSAGAPSRSRSLRSTTCPTTGSTSSRAATRISSATSRASARVSTSRSRGTCRSACRGARSGARRSRASTASARRSATCPASPASIVCGPPARRSRLMRAGDPPALVPRRHHGGRMVPPPRHAGVRAQGAVGRHRDRADRRQADISSAKVPADLLVTGMRQAVKTRTPVSIGYPTVDLDTLFVKSAEKVFAARGVEVRTARARPLRRRAGRRRSRA